MDLTKIKENDTLRIKGKDYEVIKIEKEVVHYLPKYRDILSFSLFEKESKRITPSHYLIYFFDNGETKILNEITKKSKKIKNSEIEIIYS